MSWLFGGHGHGGKQNGNGNGKSAPGQQRQTVISPNASNVNARQQFMVFETANPWRAQFSQVFVCNNSQDNVPTETILTKAQKENFTFIISQSTDGGYKETGQDCMAIAKHLDWECTILCDGHDEDGHLMSQGVCSTLPHVLLRMIHSRFPDEVREPIEDDMIYDAFDETEQVVCWMTTAAVQAGEYVRIIRGDYEGVHGYVTGYDEEENLPIVSILEHIDPNGDRSQYLSTYRSSSFASFNNSNGKNANTASPRLSQSRRSVTEIGYIEVIVEHGDLLVPRFAGGCTCVIAIRNVKTNECRIAVAGDSRLMLCLPPESLYKSQNPASGLFADDLGFTSNLTIDDPVLVPIYGKLRSEVTGKPNLAFLTPQHNVHNQDELRRLSTDFPKMYTIKDNYLINPETNFMIQPTRGFGDHDMHGTGYTHVPQITKTFILPSNTLVLAASDGIFDDNVWTEHEIVDRICELYDAQLSSNDVSKTIYEESLERSLEGGYVDDISVFSYNAPIIEKIAKSAAVVVDKKPAQLEPPASSQAQPNTRLGSAASALGHLIGLADDDPMNSSNQNMQMRTSLDIKGSLEALRNRVANVAPPHPDAAAKQSRKNRAAPPEKHKTIQRGKDVVPTVIKQILQAGNSLEALESFETTDVIRDEDDDMDKIEKGVAEQTQHARLRRFEPKPPAQPKTATKTNTAITLSGDISPSTTYGPDDGDLLSHVPEATLVAEPVAEPLGGTQVVGKPGRMTMIKNSKTGKKTKPKKKKIQKKEQIRAKAQKRGKIAIIQVNDNSANKRTNKGKKQ